MNFVKRENVYDVEKKNYVRGRKVKENSKRNFTIDYLTSFFFFTNIQLQTVL